MTKLYIIKEGWTNNPLANGKARNMPCPCGSMKKAKKCCGQFRLMKTNLANKCKSFIEHHKNWPRHLIEEVQKEKMEAMKKIELEKLNTEV